ncbi:sodium:proton antiporter NhaD [Vibrio sp. SS-MA-C1-2]|uniref:sodium:proton antiporter NhaD n=1 Tax=Vibrio sp. SS-MA-C1-2 TaxID=2908646 RepID=UPI001F3AFBF6|nr:sodium:proton antiporter NhaD [Vibrio sp. SS-MA-C1-2]UJF16855.1 sodium:proton antiporter NhaD [Vibrio sp. SS-MA-C1-2]
MKRPWKLGLLALLPYPTLASNINTPDLTLTITGFLCLAIFIISYCFVMAEEHLKMRKSKPVLLAAGLIWILVGWQFSQLGMSEQASIAIKHNLLEYTELLLFLLVAMTYINALEERRLFDVLRAWMIKKGFSFYQLFWLTGWLAFFISPIADNLTTALLMCTVILKVGGNNTRFINMACVNIVVAANAGGAFSPFGDITTLMVWQAGIVEFSQFLTLFIPSVVNFIIPAFIMSFFVEKSKPEAINEFIELKRGAKRMVCFFLLTILTAVLFHSLLGFPPVIGMMMGLAYLQFFGYFLRKTLPSSIAKKRAFYELKHDEKALKRLGNIVPFDVFNRVSHAEWDTLLFFYGIVMSVGGLNLLGYMDLVSSVMYTQWDHTLANAFVGILSAIIDNIPVMFAVLAMEPDMALGQWLLVTLTAGVGGSLLSIGSAAGVALMGHARGKYTFFGHLRWAPVIALGYVASILCHLWLNSALF